jgi:glucosamine--fructose-6-phosphate aminotransferase (isomerizing)
MCGIVGGLSKQDVIPFLLRGLSRLEYRGYDSCGLAVHQGGELRRVRTTSRVEQLHILSQQAGLCAQLGIAHTRWATHGAPTVQNAHPHLSDTPDDPHPAKSRPLPTNGSGSASELIDRIAIVHNGIIENFDTVKATLTSKGYVFQSQTDTEVVAHLIHSLYQGNLLAAVQTAVQQLQGAYALAVLSQSEPTRLVAVRRGSPLVLGIGIEGHFIASDVFALSSAAEQMVYLEDGDIVDIHLDHFQIYDAHGQIPHRPVHPIALYETPDELGLYQHHMQKEIFEQPRAIAKTLMGVEKLDPGRFGSQAPAILRQIDRILILACGTSYYSASVAKYWLETLAALPTQVEIASEYRYRFSIPHPNTLVIVVSQSGETADTLSALMHAKSLGMPHTLAICNVASSAMVRACEMNFITQAGLEIGVASTKAFTTQLVGLFLLALTLAKERGQMAISQIQPHIHALHHLPEAVEQVLALEPQILTWAHQFASKENVLFLGRGMHYPIALEGALKLKEISYIHAEAYPAGELKHGPLALITHAMPVVAVAPNDALLDKLKSNLQEVQARGGQLYVLADSDTAMVSTQGEHIIHLPAHYGALSPVLHVVPLQLLAYHTARIRGTDVDKPRNLAKSVTVE